MIRIKVSIIWSVSVFTVFRNFLLAGTLKKRSLTSTSVPAGDPVSSIDFNFPPVTFTLYPLNWSAGREVISIRETAAMLGIASPRNPSVVMEGRSEMDRILLVACLSKQRRRSSRFIPIPLSVTLMSPLPPFSILTVIRLDSASMLLSSNSLSTEAGLSITSPAAIFVAVSSVNTLIKLIIIAVQKLLDWSKINLNLRITMDVTKLE